MTLFQMAQLSMIRSILEKKFPSSVENEQVLEILNLIDHDVKYKTKYNTDVQALCDCIDEDTAIVPLFDLSTYALKGDNRTCKTMEKCKELFDL